MISPWHSEECGKLCDPSVAKEVGDCTSHCEAIEDFLAKKQLLDAVGL